MDCDDVMLAIAANERTLTADEQDGLHRHLAECASCRALSTSGDEHWRWVVRIPAEALDGDGPVLPVVDPVVFDVGTELASGGMGRITRAFDRRLGRDVAIKEVLAPNMRARFEREATITARLQHPAIVPIYEAGAWPNGSAFYTMRLVDGRTLAQAIAEAKTTPARIALLPHVVAATEALAYAHAKRIVHRDLKPGNVLVGEFGETVVIDWGLAKELDRPGPDSLPGIVPASAELTRAGSVLGTPGFMPPEQAAGEDVDERADVYALGAILYNVLCGVPPYFDTFASAERLVEIVRVDPPTSIAKLAPDAPEDLHAIVERAMARDKDARYRTAKEMADELRRFEAGKLIAARAYTMRDLIARWIRRHRTAVVVGAVAALTLAVVGVLALIDVTRSRASERDAREVSERTTDALLEEQGRTEMLAGDHERALAYLAEASRRGRETPALHFLLADATRDTALLATTIAPPQLTTSCGNDPNCAGPDVASLGYTADGRLVLVEETGRISVWKDGALLRSFPIGSFTSAQLDSKATRAAVSGDHVLEVWDVERGERLWRVDDPALDRAELLWDRDDTRLLALPDDDDVKDATVRYARTGEVVGKITLGEHIAHAAFADDDSLAAVGASGTAVVWGTSPMVEQRRWKATKDATSIAFVPPDSVVIGAPDVEIWRYYPDVVRTHVLSGHEGGFITAVPHGDLIAVGDDGGVQLWTTSGARLAESRGEHGRIDKLMFTRDALVGVSLDDRVTVWDTPTLERRATITVRSVDVVAVSATRIVAAGDQRVHEWSMPAGHRIARVPAQTAVLAGDRFVAVTFDGTIVARNDTGAEVARIAVSAPSDARARVAASRDGRRVLIHAKEDAWIVDVAANTPPRHLTWLGSQMAMSPDGRYVAELGDDDNGKHFAHVFDAATGAKTFELRFKKREAPAGFDISADRLVIGFAGAVKQWGLATGTPLSTLAVPGKKDVDYLPQFAPTGTAYAALSSWLPNTVLVYDTATNAQLAKIDAGEEIGEVVFSRDNRLVLAATDRAVPLWDVQTGKQLASFAGRKADAYAFSADAARVATGGGDGTIRLWDTGTGQLLTSFRAHQGAIERVEFSDDNTRLLAVGKDGYATLWDIHLDRQSPSAIGELAAHSAWRFEDGLLKPR